MYAARSLLEAGLMALLPDSKPEHSDWHNLQTTASIRFKTKNASTWLLQVTPRGWRKHCTAVVHIMMAHGQFAFAWMGHSSMPRCLELPDALLCLPPPPASGAGWLSGQLHP